MFTSTPIRSLGACELTALRLLFISAIAAALMMPAPLEAQTSASDLIFVNAKIYTVDAAFSTAEAVAITNGKFAAVGASAQVRRPGPRRESSISAGRP